MLEWVLVIQLPLRVPWLSKLPLTNTSITDFNKRIAYQPGFDSIAKFDLFIHFPYKVNRHYYMSFQGKFHTQCDRNLVPTRDNFNEECLPGVESNTCSPIGVAIWCWCGTSGTWFFGRESMSLGVGSESLQPCPTSNSLSASCMSMGMWSHSFLLWPPTAINAPASWILPLELYIKINSSFHRLLWSWYCAAALKR